MLLRSEKSHDSHLSNTNLDAGLLRGPGGDLGVVVGVRTLHGEPHHGGSDGGWWSVVIGELKQ